MKIIFSERISIHIFQNAVFFFFVTLILIIGFVVAFIYTYIFFLCHAVPPEAGVDFLFVTFYLFFLPTKTPSGIIKRSPGERYTFILVIPLNYTFHPQIIIKIRKKKAFVSKIRTCTPLWRCK